MGPIPNMPAFAMALISEVDREFPCVPFAVRPVTALDGGSDHICIPLRAGVVWEEEPVKADDDEGSPKPAEVG